MIRGKKLKLIGFKEVDAMDPCYQLWFEDPDVTRYNSHGLFPKTEKAFADFVEEVHRGDRLVYKIMRLKKNGPDEKEHFHWEWIGNVSLQSFNWINRSAELAIVIGDKKSWGGGYGTEACQLIIKHAFDSLNLNRVWTGTAEINMGMRSVAIRCGMLPEGRFKEGMHLNGMYVDILSYGIIATQYRSFQLEEQKDDDEKFIEGSKWTDAGTGNFDPDHPTS